MLFSYKAKISYLQAFRYFLSYIYILLQWWMIMSNMVYISNEEIQDLNNMQSTQNTFHVI